MTPKEKAHDLFNKFTAIEFDIIHKDCEGDTALVSGMCTIKNAQKCAMIAVDEIINLLSTLAKPEYVAFIIKDVYTISDTEYQTHAHGYELIEYWQQTKIEIEKL